MDAGALIEPSDWKYKPLEELDQLLRCPICFEYYKTAMMFPQCSHNFCSLCIRRYLSASNSKCPLCVVSVVESDLKNNRMLDQIIHSFTSNRSSLLSLIRQGHSNQKVDDKEDKGLSNDGKGLGNYRKEGEIKVRENCTNSEEKFNDIDYQARVSSFHGKRRLYSVPEAPELPDSEALIGDILTSNDNTWGGEGGGGEGDVDNGTSSDVASPSVLLPWQPEDDMVCEGDSKRARLFGDLGVNEKDSEEDIRTRSHSTTSMSTPSRSAAYSSSSNDLNHQTPSDITTVTMGTPTINHTHNNSSIAEVSPSSDKVECPVCGHLILARFINRHLDSVCLRPQETTPTTSTQRRYTKVPRLVYTLMKDKQLKSKLKEYHLPTHGDRQALINRLKEFILRFNSQCDSLSPKPPKMIAIEIEREERQRKTKKQTQSPVVRIMRECKVEEIEKEKKEYAEVHKDQFSKLIKQVRERQDNDDDGCDLGEKESELRQITGRNSDCDNRERLVLCPASPDCDLTPPLEGTSTVSHLPNSTIVSSTAIRSTITIPESPRPCTPHTGRPRRKRKAPPTPSLVNNSDEDKVSGRENDEEFLPTPNTSHYHIPSSTHCTSSKRARRCR